jgi:hypothetical protein
MVSGEMALAFSNIKHGYEVFSSQCYNYFNENWVEDYWTEFIENNRMAVLEASVYKRIKTGKKTSSGVRKVDILLQDKNQICLSEIKILWLHNLSPTPNSYLESKKILGDARRLKKQLYEEIKNETPIISRFLTLICVAEKDKNGDIINKYLSIIKNSIDDHLHGVNGSGCVFECSKVGDYEVKNIEFCPDIYETGNQKEFEFSIFLVTIEV